MLFGDNMDEDDDGLGDPFTLSSDVELSDQEAGLNFGSDISDD